MLASTFMDLVLGVDIHFEMVPMPAPVPTPIPNPFVGMVFDPAGKERRDSRPGTSPTPS